MATHAEHTDATLSDAILPPLLQAASERSLGMVKSLLEHRAEYRVKPNLTGKWGWNALHYLADAGPGSGNGDVTITIAELLIGAGTNPLARDIHGWIPLHVAAASGNLTLLSFLRDKHPISLGVTDNDGMTVIDFGSRHSQIIHWVLSKQKYVNIDNADTNGRTTLMKLVIAGNIESTRELLNMNADPTIQDKNGINALHIAAFYGNIEIAKALLEKKPEILMSKDTGNRTALHKAILCEKPDFAYMLLDRYYAYAENRREDLSAKDTDYGRTPLIYAVYKRYTKVIERLLHLGAKTETRDNRMKSALIVAARRGDVSIIELLVSYGVDINAGGRIYSGIYRTALYEAASRNQPDVVKCLLAANAKVNQEGGKYNTALCAACCTGDESTVSLLLEKGADITLSGGRFVNALSCAVYSKSASLVNRLINAGIEASEINAQDKQGRTAVHIAARYCDWEVIGMLRNKGADLAKVDKQHRTLLHYAVLGSDLSLVMSILNDEMLRSQIHARDVDQWTPLHWACRVIGNSSVVSALIDHGADVRGLTPYGWTPQNIAIFHDEPEIARVLEENAKENDCNTNVAPSDAPDREADPKAAIRRQWRVASHKSSSKCDSCFTEIRGVRWECKTCWHFSFCFKCYWTAEETHDNTHSFIQRHGGNGNPEKEPKFEEIEEHNNSPEPQSVGSSDKDRDEYVFV